MTAPNEVVFLLDIDNTLLDNDRIVADLDDHLRREFGRESRDRYWAIFEALRVELGYADYLGALQRYRLGAVSDPRLLLMSSFLVDYPFADRLYAGALDVIEHLRAWGLAVILSDGDVVFQPRKAQRSGLWDAVEGRVLIYVHKEQMLDDVESRYPARHYVMVDDKLRILTAMKTIWSDRLTTVFPRQGHYALDPKNIAAYPPADLTVARIGDLVNCDLPTLLGAREEGWIASLQSASRAQTQIKPEERSRNDEAIRRDTAMKINPLAGKPAEASMLVNVPKLVTAYYTEIPDPSVPEQRVAFGTSGHRGAAFAKTFNERHVVAVSQAICEYRKRRGIDGPLFLGIDTHALSVPAGASALEVLAANGVDVMLAENDDYTPTPAVSHAILTYNRGRDSKLADGVVITPSHNPPDNGGFKYNPPNGGPADADVTGWIEAKANELLESGLRGVKRIPFEQAARAATTHRHDFLSAYVADLGNVIDMDAIRGARLRMGVDPLGGAGVHYWPRIAERYGLNLTVVNETVDPTFRFMTLDWDGRIRMDPSSPYAMQRLIELKDRFDIAFACDTDHDRHGIITRSAGLLPPNHYLAVAIFYLFQHRPKWSTAAAVGKTVVSSRMIDRVAAKLGRKLYEVPVGFKWFVDGLLDGSLGFGGEESAGASFLRRDGGVWTTDKDGIVPALLSAEINARMGRDPGEIYGDLAREFGAPVFERIDAPATPAQKAMLSKLSAQQVKSQDLAGEKIQSVLTHAPGNGAAIGGLKVLAESGWFAARPSGTEDIYKIYAESFRGADHLRRILEEAQTIVSEALTPPQRGGGR